MDPEYIYYLCRTPNWPVRVYSGCVDLVLFDEEGKKVYACANDYEAHSFFFESANEVFLSQKEALVQARKENTTLIAQGEYEKCTHKHIWHDTRETVGLL